MRVAIGFLVIIAMVLLWAGALCTPSHLYEDNDAGLTSLEVREVKAEASSWRKIPAAWLQIAEVVSRPAATGESDVRSLPDAVVVWYAPFGIKYGRTEMVSGWVVHQSFDEGRETMAWGLLFVPELALLGLAAFCFAPAIRRRWPKIQERVSRWERRHF